LSRLNQTSFTNKAGFSPTEIEIPQKIVFIAAGFLSAKGGMGGFLLSV
jgi:hypothetical protein